MSRIVDLVHASFVLEQRVRPAKRFSTEIADVLGLARVNLLMSGHDAVQPEDLADGGTSYR